MPLVKADKVSWVKLVMTFSIAGLVSSSFVGAAIAVIGDQLPEEIPTKALGLVGMTLVICLLARELGISTIPLPEIRRQTNPIWVRQFRPIVAYGLWGVDIGLTFSTWQRFASGWALAITVLASRDIFVGATVFGAYWLGRIGPLWLSPALFDSRLSTSEILSRVSKHQLLFRVSVIVGLVAVLAYLAGTIVG